MREWDGRSSKVGSPVGLRSGAASPKSPRSPRRTIMSDRSEISADVVDIGLSTRRANQIPSSFTPIPEKESIALRKKSFAA